MKKLIPLIFIIFIGTLSLSFQTNNEIPTISKLIELKNGTYDEFNLKARQLGFAFRMRDQSEGTVYYMFTREKKIENITKYEVLTYTISSTNIVISLLSPVDFFLHYQNEINLNKYHTFNCSTEITNNNTSTCYTNNKNEITINQSNDPSVGNLYTISVIK